MAIMCLDSTDENSFYTLNILQEKLNPSLPMVYLATKVDVNKDTWSIPSFFEIVKNHCNKFCLSKPVSTSVVSAVKSDKISHGSTPNNLLFFLANAVRSP